MKNPKKFAELSPDQQEVAALAALGAVSPREAMAAARFAILEMEEAAALLAAAVPPVPPSPPVRERLLKRVAAFEHIRPIADVRRDENTWIHSGMPGVDVKMLFKEAGLGRTTYLVRMEPGARLPRHHHGDIEQCLVLEGDIRWGDIVYEKGDFVAMGKDTHHPEIYSVRGNLLLLISGHNDFAR